MQRLQRSWLCRQWEFYDAMHPDPRTTACALPRAVYLSTKVCEDCLPWNFLQATLETRFLRSQFPTQLLCPVSRYLLITQQSICMYLAITTLSFEFHQVLSVMVCPKFYFEFVFGNLPVFFYCNDKNVVCIKID